MFLKNGSCRGTRRFSVGGRVGAEMAGEQNVFRGREADPFDEIGLRCVDLPRSLLQRIRQLLKTGDIAVLRRGTPC